MGGRLELIGTALQSFVVWARVLDARRRFPFGDAQLGRSQVEVLFVVAHSDAPTTPSRLAEVLGVTRGAVTQLVAGLIDAGLVEQRTDPADQRRRVLVLSPSCRERVDTFEEDVARELVPLFDGLDDNELKTLANLLSRTRRDR